MNISNLFSKIQRLADDNAPVILTGMAVSGAFLTTYLTYKGTMKSAGQLLQTLVSYDSTENTERRMSKPDIFVLTWKNYLPAAMALTGTSACMIMATKIGINRSAALAGALVVTERTYDQYKEKVRETLGEAKHTKVVDAVATEQAAGASNQSMIVLGDDEQWCLDAWSGRLFKGKMEKLERAVNELNAQMLSHDYASLTDFYDLVGLPPNGHSDDIGWKSEHLLKPKYTSVLHENKPCIVLTFDPIPTARFQDTHS